MRKYIIQLLSVILISGCEFNSIKLSKNEEFCVWMVYNTLRNNIQKGLAYSSMPYRPDRHLNRENQVLIWDDPDFQSKITKIEDSVVYVNGFRLHSANIIKELDHKYLGNAAKDLVKLGKETTFYNSCMAYLETFDKCNTCGVKEHQFQWNVNNYMNMGNGRVDFSKFNKDHYNFLYFKD